MRLVSKEDVTEGIGTLFLAVTTGCNLRCVHCSADARAGGTCEHMSKEVYEEILRQAPSIGATHIVLSGGEPTLHPGITEMTRAALRQGHSVAISTNGTTRVRALMDLLEENADRALVQVSIDGDKHTHERIRQVEGSFDAALTMLRDLRRRGVRASVAYTVHAENYSVIPEAVDTAAGLGVPLRLGLLHPIGRGKQLSPLACEQVMLLVEMAEKARSYGLDVTTNLPPAIDPDSLNRPHNLGACGWGWDLLGIQPDGVVWLCVNTPRVEAARGGSILRRPISDMISERDNGIGRARQLSAQDLKGVCAKCGAAEICGGACRTLALEVYGDLSGPFPTCQRLYDAGVIQPEQIVLESSSA